MTVIRADGKIKTRLLKASEAKARWKTSLLPAESIYSVGQRWEHSREA